MHVLDDAESVRAAAAIRFALAVTEALEPMAGVPAFSTVERQELRAIADRLAPAVPVAREPEFDPPRITCCETAIATGGAYHRPGCAAVPA